MSLVELKPTPKILTPDGWVLHRYMTQEILEAVLTWHTAALAAQRARDKRSQDEIKN